MTMVAEGVEDGATADQLTLSSCDKIQGFFFSKALPSGELEAWMDARAPQQQPSSSMLGSAAGTAT
jgi:EAL domain-containing protein (putative c-di-GMP-specific phosphodiesterase class I)